MTIWDALIDVPIPILKTRIPIPVTINMIIVLVVGGILTAILTQLPGRLKILSTITALGTLLGAVVIGIDDLRGGDLFDRATNSECAGWNDHVNNIESVASRYDGIMDRYELATFDQPKAELLAAEVNALSEELSAISPPVAALALHNGWVEILNEIESQFRSFHQGGSFEVDRLNRLTQQQASLVAEANRTCA